MNPATREKITKGLKTTEFWVVLLMGVLTSIMVTIQDHAQTVLPIELQMKILGGLATAYVICRTALKLAGLVATMLRIDRGDPLPVPAPPAGVTLPQVSVPTIPGLDFAAPPVQNIADPPVQDIRTRADGYVPWTTLRAEKIARDEAAAARDAALKAMLQQAGTVQPEPPPLVLSTSPQQATPDLIGVRGH